MTLQVPQKKVSDEEMVTLRNEKVDLNRKSRRHTGMSKVCKGKADGLLECQNQEGRCPEFDECHKPI
ncbi:hypothetical protein HYY75_00285 [bacterium]|nr:hypothetical protein [bacterium]